MRAVLCMTHAQGRPCYIATEGTGARMSTEAGLHKQSTDHEHGSGEPQVADVLVVFGITGDLAKVMTFRSLYRLEKRGLLELPDRRRRGR